MSRSSVTTRTAPSALSDSESAAMPPPTSSTRAGRAPPITARTSSHARWFRITVPGIIQKLRTWRGTTR